MLRPTLAWSLFFYVCFDDVISCCGEFYYDNHRSKHKSSFAKQTWLGSKAALAQCSGPHSPDPSLFVWFVLIMLLVVAVRVLLITLMTTIDHNLNHHLQKQTWLDLPLVSRDDFWSQNKLWKPNAKLNQNRIVWGAWARFDKIWTEMKEIHFSSLVWGPCFEGPGGPFPGSGVSGVGE